MEHVEAKKVSVKILKIKGHTFRTANYSKAGKMISLRHARSTILMPSKITEAH